MEIVKHIHRFFLTGHISKGDRVILEGDDSFHASNVLKLRKGDTVELADSDGRVFSSTIVSSEGLVEAHADRLLSQAGTAGSKGEEQSGGDGTTRITIVQALPAGRKMDLVVEKLSELGVTRLVPVFTERSVVRDRSRDGKPERWRRLARSAAAQSRRSTIMEVTDPQPLGRWLSGNRDPLIALVTENDGMPLSAAADMIVGDLCLLVGPESGFSDAEIGLLRDHGALLTGLGPLLLRTETAALVAGAIVMHRKGFIG